MVMVPGRVVNMTVHPIEARPVGAMRNEALVTSEEARRGKISTAYQCLTTLQQ